MSIEQEAAEFVDSKRTIFKEALAEYVEPLERYILDNLHHSDEREVALIRLKESILWCRHCADLFGIK
jgi:hypothetical protein